MGHLEFIANQVVQGAAQVKNKYAAGVSVCVCVSVCLYGWAGLECWQALCLHCGFHEYSVCGRND